MIRLNIDSDEIILNKLNNENPWIPNFDQVRRSNETEDEYQKFLSTEMINYKSKEDYIKKKILLNKDFVLVKNRFPYKVDKNTKHYIMWFLKKIDDNDTISLNIVSEFIRLKLYKDNLEFVWYENPKISGRLYHVHVFFHYK